MRIIADGIDFANVAQLICAIEDLTPSHIIRREHMYVLNQEGEELTNVSLEQETLSDGSIVFNLILSTTADPNS